jgi:hypothetical protein
MKVGQIKQSVSTSARNMGNKVPQHFVLGPELRWGLQLYYDSFFDLDSERSHGSGYTRIAWSSIVNYAAYYEFSEDQTERLVAHIFAMDVAYINTISAEAEAKRK